MKKSSYQRAQAIAADFIDELFNDIESKLDRSVGRQGFFETKRIIRSHLYAAAHKAIVGEMRAAAKARKAAK